MNAIKVWDLYLDVNKNRETACAEVTIRQQDNLSNVLHIHVTDNGAAVQYDNATVELAIPIGGGQSVELACTLTDGVAVVEIPYAISTLEADTRPYCKIISDSGTVLASTQSFRLNIVPCAGDVSEAIDVLDYGPYIEVRQTLAETEQAIQDCEDAAANVYSPTIDVTAISGGHQVDMTYKDNGVLTTESFNVMDGATGAAAGFGTPTASVDSSVGTPSVTITASGPDTAKVFDFAFSRLKGDTGATGATGTPGTAAGFGTPTATVDSLVGTPSVSVAASGPDTAKVFDFAFSGIKGEQGVKGDTGDTGPQGAPGTAAGFGTPTATIDASVGTPSVTVTASGPDTAKVFDFAFSNLKGEPAQPIYAKQSGSVIAASTAYAGEPLHSVEVYGASEQSGTPTPSSPVAIDSVTSASACVYGKNLLDESSASANTVLYSTGIAGTSAGFKTSGYISVVGGQSYTFSLSQSALTFTCWYESDQTHIQRVQNTAAQSATLTAPSNARYMRFCWYENNVVTWAQLEVGSTATAYTPYIAGTTTPVDLQGNVMRGLPDGTADVLSIDSDGAVTLTQSIYEVTLDGTETWEFYSVSNGTLNLHRCLLSNSGYPRTVNATVKLCNYYPYSASRVDDSIVTSAANYIDIIDNSYASVDTWKAHLVELNTNGTPLEVVYILETPTTTTLPSVTMPTAPGADLTVWADTDVPTTLSVEYREQLQLVIDELRARIAALE